MKKVFWLIVSSVAIISCNNSSSQKQENEATEKVATTASSRDTATELSDETIVLNNGEKWMVNQEMRPFIQAGENLLNTYVAAKSADYKKLAEQLKEKNTALIKSCTMQGKSHEELHQWLHPHLALVAALGKAENQEQANELVLQLQQSFELFHQYFQ